MKTTTATAASVRNVFKTFRDFWGRDKVRAVRGVSFDVGAGEIFGLLGPNGSGKSTVIKILLGLLAPTRGAVSLFGRSPRETSVKARIGYLPEETRLYPSLTPVETLDFYGGLFGLPGAERRRRSGQLLDMTGLAGAARRPVGEFSKGMARRIGLAQALINDPDLLLLDEPTSGLDPIGCRQIKDLLLALAARGKTVILSSHLLADVESVCGRIAVLFDGRVIARGDMRDLLRDKTRRRLTFDALAESEMTDILATLRERFGANPEVDAPSISLERFFLDAVSNARAEAGRAPSGADPTERVAEYLSGESKKRASGPLESLVIAAAEETRTGAPENRAVPAPKETAENGEADADKKIERILRGGGDAL